MPFTEDATEFLDIADFATSATYNGATTIKGIFNADDLEHLGIIAGTNPTFLCAKASVDADPTGKTLLIGAVTYKIRDFKPQDNNTFMLLELEKQ